MTSDFKPLTAILILLVATILIFSGVYYLAVNNISFGDKYIDACEKSYGAGWTTTNGKFGANYCTGPTGDIKGYKEYGY